MSENIIELKCDCGKSTFFNETEMDIEILTEMGGNSFIQRTSNKEYICEHCGEKLEV